MKQHDQGADANVVGAIGETEQEDGRQMMDHLFLKILPKQAYQCLCTVKCVSRGKYGLLITQ